MLMLSMKLRKRRIVAVCFAFVLTAIAATVAFASGKGADLSAVSAFAVNADTNSGRIEFLQSFGWEVSEEPVEIEAVIIPSQFSDVYENYNEIQKQQDCDLSEYKACEVKRYTYEVRNYPLTDNTLSGTIRANLLVYEGRVIGGDVCSVSLGGFLHGFAIKNN